MSSSDPQEPIRRSVEAFDRNVPLEQAWTPPSAWYQSSAMAEFERQHVFPSSWQLVGRATQVSEPGCYLSGCFAGEPWVVVRGNDRTLRAFYNVCRHKGREVVTGEGSAQQLVCGYHAWRYDLDGKLRSAPRMAGIQNFAREEMGLKPMSVSCWGPWVFIRQDGEGSSLGQDFPEVDTTIEQSGWEQLRFAGRKSWVIECNWKVYVDNYLDGGYHVPHMHPSLNAQIDIASYRTETYARSSIQSCSPIEAGNTSADRARALRIGERAIYAWLYPNFMLNRYGPCLDINHVVPLGPTRCRVDYEFFFDPDSLGDTASAQAFIKQSIEQSDLTQQEDVAICESVQVGLASASYDRGRYAPQVEQGEHHFHCLLSEDYHRALDPPPAP